MFKRWRDFVFFINITCQFLIFVGNISCIKNGLCAISDENYLNQNSHYLLARAGGVLKLINKVDYFIH